MAYALAVMVVQETFPEREMVAGTQIMFIDSTGSSATCASA